MEDRITYALKNFLNDKFHYDANLPTYELIEYDKGGKSQLIVNVGTAKNICVKNYDKFPKWGMLNNSKESHMNKCVDHFILKQNNLDTWELHIFEMKTSIGVNAWLDDIRYKMRSSYLSIKAIAVYLGITIKDEDITIYITYENDEYMDISKMHSPQTILPTIGGRAVDLKNEEWDAGIIRVPIIISESNPYNVETFVKLRHKKILMKRSSNEILENEISLHDSVDKKT